MLSLNLLFLFNFNFQTEKCSIASSRKILVPGRIIALSRDAQKNVPGVVLTIEKENKCKVLVVSERKDYSNNCDSSEPKITPWSRQLYYPHNRYPEVITVPYKAVETISNKTIRIQENDVLKEWMRMEKT